MIKKMVGALTVAFLLTGAAQVPEIGELRIATTTTTLASMVEYLTQGQARVHAVASPKRNLHYIEPSPKDVLMVKKADLFIHHGFQAEPWLEPLLQAAANTKFLGASEYRLDASKGVQALEVPDEISRRDGDIHIAGNPHYWTDPENAKIMIRNIAEFLSILQPELASLYQERTDAYIRRLDEKILEWQKRLAPYRGAGIVTYHRSWSYFAERFGFHLIGEIEPLPGIPPTSKHLAKLLDQIQQQNADFIVKETYFERRTPERLAEKAGIPVVDLIQFVGEKEEASDYFSMIDYNVTQIEKALGKPV